MPTHTETFLGSKIEVTDSQELTIDGKLLQPTFDAATQQWSSQYLPYTTYSSLLDLAHAIVRDTEEFSQQR